MIRFADREDAGRQLAPAIAALNVTEPLLAGIPRGGVVVAAAAARALRVSVVPIVARKIGAPAQPELAIGAVTADGPPWIDHELAGLVGATSEYLAAATAREVEEARRRASVYAAPPVASFNAQDIIVVDDGIATGATVVAAVRSARAAGARYVAVATPVAPPSTVERLREEADEVCALVIDAEFVAIGQFYDDFHAVSDGEVLAALSGR